MYTINQLVGLSSHLQQLLQQASRLQQLTTKIRSLLPTHLANYCEVASWANDIIIIHTTNAAAGTVLRYQLPKILPLLQIDSNYKNVKQLICHIRPVTPAKKDSKAVRPPSIYAATLLQSTAENINTPAVQKALQRLAHTLLYPR